MAYLLLILSLALVGVCALGAYELLDAIERDEAQAASRAPEPARAFVPEASSLPGGSTPRPPAQLWHASPHARGTQSGAAEADWLDGRIRGLEERLDRLVRDCLRLEALVQERSSSWPSRMASR